MTEALEYKKEINGSIEKVKEVSMSNNRKLAEDFDMIAHGMRDRHEAFRTDTKTLTESI